jgi:SAM-dependent methyltransferase
LYTYDQQFYRYINRGALESAAVLVPLLQQIVPGISSVLDVGCGAGAWLSVWRDTGAEITGIDGDYVERSALLIEPASFHAADLAAGFSLSRKFDLAQCLEVAEHLPEAGGRALVTSLCEHADIVLFSAAAPGQGGENHINEQPYQYWRDLFAECGFAMYDPLRQQLLGESAVKPWYRYNTFLFLREDSRPDLHAALAAQVVPRDQLPRDISPRVYQLRKQLVRQLPPLAMTWLARLKKHLLPRLPGAKRKSV